MTSCIALYGDHHSMVIAIVTSSERRYVHGMPVRPTPVRAGQETIKVVSGKSVSETSPANPLQEPSRADFEVFAACAAS